MPKVEYLLKTRQSQMKEYQKALDTFQGTLGEFREKYKLPSLFVITGRTRLDNLPKWIHDDRTIILYPYAGLGVGGANHAVYLNFPTDEYFNDFSYTYIICSCSGYSSAEVPPLEFLKDRWRQRCAQ